MPPPQNITFICFWLPALFLFLWCYQVCYLKPEPFFQEQAVFLIAPLRKNTGIEGNKQMHVTVTFVSAWYYLFDTCQPSVLYILIYLDLDLVNLVLLAQPPRNLLVKNPLKSPNLFQDKQRYKISKPTKFLSNDFLPSHQAHPIFQHLQEV